MCIGFEGELISTAGEGVTRSGILRVDDRDHEIGLAFVPEAQIGDRLIVHSGLGIRVVGEGEGRSVLG